MTGRRDRFGDPIEDDDEAVDTPQVVEVAEPHTCRPPGSGWTARDAIPARPCLACKPWLINGGRS